MSRLDEYEYLRGPVRRARRRPPFKTYRVSKPERQTQLALKLAGGTTAKDKGMPFNDEIPF